MLPHRCFHFQLHVTEYVDSLEIVLHQLTVYFGKLTYSLCSTYLNQFPFIGTVPIPCHGHSKSVLVINI